MVVFANCLLYIEQTWQETPRNHRDCLKTEIDEIWWNTVPHMALLICVWLYNIIYIYTYYYIYTRYSYIVMRKIMIGQKDFRDGPDDDLTGQQCLEKWWDRRIDWV
jgi:hypothetical protein